MTPGLWTSYSLRYVQVTDTPLLQLSLLVSIQGMSHYELPGCNGMIGTRSVLLQTFGLYMVGTEEMPEPVQIPAWYSIRGGRAHA